VEQNVRMGYIHQISRGEEKALIQYLDKMIQDGKIRPSSSLVRSPVLIVPNQMERVYDLLLISDININIQSRIKHCY
jgi:protein involved in polysaccharide export with SLBB domain